MANDTTATRDGADVQRAATATPNFPRLECITRTHLTTGEAAFYLNRREQTLRAWACLENGPLRPMRVHGRLAWPLADLRRVLGVA